MKFILTLIIILVAFNKLSALEKDSTENVEPKPRYVGLSIGLGAPEIVFIGLSARLTKDYYLNYSIGGYPKENN